MLKQEDHKLETSQSFHRIHGQPGLQQQKRNKRLGTNKYTEYSHTIKLPIIPLPRLLTLGDSETNYFIHNYPENTNQLKKKHLNHLCIPYPYVIWCSVFSRLNSSQWNHSWKTSLTSRLPNNYTGCCRKALHRHCHASGECLRCCHFWFLPVIWDTKILLNIEKKNEGITLHFIVTPNESVLQLESGPVKCWVVNTVSSVLCLIFI